MERTPSLIVGLRPVFLYRDAELAFLVVHEPEDFVGRFVVVLDGLAFEGEAGKRRVARMSEQAGEGRRGQMHESFVGQGAHDWVRITRDGADSGRRKPRAEGVAERVEAGEIVAAVSVGDEADETFRRAAIMV